MAEETTSGPARRRARIEEGRAFAIEREGSGEDTAGRAEAARRSGSASVPGREAADAGAGSSLPYPARVARKYYVVPGPEERSAERRAFADERGEYLVFKDAGSRLTTRREETGVVRDLVAIAAHRGWPAIRATGSAAFRREVWLEASTRSLSVRGYEPTDLDRQALEKRRAERARSSARDPADAAEREETPPGQRSAVPRQVHPPSPAKGEGRRRSEPAIDYDRGVSGRLIEVGSAPYRNQDGKAPSAYLEVELKNGDRHRIWGSGLREAARASGIQPGEHIQVRRTGFEVVPKTVSLIDPDKGPIRAEPQLVRRNRWVIERDRFRTLPRGEAVRDPNLAAAHSHLAVLERALTRAFPEDARARDAVLDVARDRLQLHLTRGNTIRRAEYAVPVLDSGAERQPDQARLHEAERDGRQRRGVRERDR